MRQRLIGNLSRNLRSLIKGADDQAASQEVDIATLAMIGRVRDEWQARQRPQAALAFGLPELLRSLDRAKSAEPEAPAPDRYEGRPRRLPARSLGRDGPSRPVDETFLARREYTVAELTDFADAVFVEIAYRCVLKRPPDPIGFSGFLQPLRDGVRERVDVLHALRMSPEGNQQNVEIRGLHWLVFWRRAERAPVVGPVVEWLHALVDLPRIAKRLRTIEARAEAGQQELSRRLDALADSDLGHHGEALVALQRSQVRLETAVVGLADRYRRFLLEVETREAMRSSARRPVDEDEPRL